MSSHSAILWEKFGYRHWHPDDRAALEWDTYLAWLDWVEEWKRDAGS